MQYDLASDPCWNADLINLLGHGEAHVRYDAPDGLLLQRCDWDKEYAAAALSKAAAGKIVPMLAGAEMIVLRGTPLKTAVDMLYAGFETREYLSAAYLHEQITPVKAEGFSIRPLTQAHAAFVHAHYRTVPDMEYVQERIDAGMLGAFADDGAIAGFCGTHGSGEIGMLEVLPAYRRHGIAAALESAMIQRTLDAHYLPFGQVGKQNAPSRALQKKCGLAESDKPVWYLFIR